MFSFGILDYVKFGAGIAVGAALVFFPARWIGRGEGRASYIAEQAVLDKKSEMQRKTDDAKLQRMSDYDLCVSNLGRVPECDGLKLQPVRQK